MDDVKMAEVVAEESHVPEGAVLEFLECHFVSTSEWSRDDVADVLEKVEEAYSGEWRNLAEYAEDFADQVGAFGQSTEDHDWPRMHIDWEAAGRDLELGGDIWTADAPGGIYVFWSHV